VPAIESGAPFLGRSFAGYKKQLLAMLKAAIAQRGTVTLDVVSPCVTFNDHEGSTKSYKYMKDHEEPLQDINLIPVFEEIDVEYDPGTTVDVTMRSEEHTSELQSPDHLVCRLLLEKKKKKQA